MNGHHKYNVEDIRLYLEGKLTPQQMHDLEMAALNDPFLADAIEGMSQHGNNEQFAADVQELNARLNERVRKKRIVPITVNNLWWKVAAVLLIVITGVAVIIFTGENNRLDNVRVAKTESKKEAAAVPDSVTNDASAFSQPAADSPASASSIGNKNTPPAKRQAHPTPSKPPAAKKESVQNLEEVSTSPPSQDLEHQQRVLQADSAVAVEGVATQKAENNAEISKVLQGKAAGVDVQATEVDDSVYDEVVIVGSGNRSNKSRALAAERIKKRIIPGKGWDDFEQYILDSTHIATSDSVYRGEEQVTFTIGDDGLPESIKILRSVSPAHDKEAIRLLRNGPSWKVIEGKRRKVTLKIIF